MASFDKITVGQVLYDYHKQSMGNTSMRREGCWEVKVLEIDPVRRTALCSWNGNRPQTYTARRIERLRVNKKKAKQ